MSITLYAHQVDAITKVESHFEKFNNGLLVAPTGSGKTVIFCHVIFNRIQRLKSPYKILLLTHQEELLSQSKSCFESISEGKVSTAVFKGNKKQYDAQVVFASLPTVHRNLQRQQAAKQDLFNVSSKEWMQIDMVVVDEAHHTRARTWFETINELRLLNPNMKLLGVTATPSRSDDKSILTVYDTTIHRITMRHLVERGFLKVPVTYQIPVKGVRVRLQTALKEAVQKKFSERKMGVLTSEIFSGTDVMAGIIDHWKRLGGNRQTVVYCGTRKHADLIAKGFQEQDVKAAAVDGTMTAAERTDILTRYTNGEITVLSNVLLLTEGWDVAETSCIVLLAHCMTATSLIQCIGRGMRRYPGIEECLILDFGISSSVHGQIDLVRRPSTRRVNCPSCGKNQFLRNLSCDACGTALEMMDGFEEGNICPFCQCKNVTCHCTHCPSCKSSLLIECPYCSSEQNMFLSWCNECGGEFVTQRTLKPPVFKPPKQVMNLFRFRWCELIPDVLWGASNGETWGFVRWVGINKYKVVMAKKKLLQRFEDSMIQFYAADPPLGLQREQFMVKETEATCSSFQRIILRVDLRMSDLGAGAGHVPNWINDLVRGQPVETWFDDHLVCARTNYQKHLLSMLCLSLETEDLEVSLL